MGLIDGWCGSECHGMVINGSFKPLESVWDGIIGECPSELLDSHNDLVCMVCAWDAFVEEGSAIDTSLIQHSLLECTSPVFC